MAYKILHGGPGQPPQASSLAISLTLDTPALLACGQSWVTACSFPPSRLFLLPLVPFPGLSFFLALTSHGNDCFLEALPEDPQLGERFLTLGTLCAFSHHTTHLSSFICCLLTNLKCYGGKCSICFARSCLPGTSSTAGPQ